MAASCFPASERHQPLTGHAQIFTTLAASTQHQSFGSETCVPKAPAVHRAVTECGHSLLHDTPHQAPNMSSPSPHWQPATRRYPRALPQHVTQNLRSTKIFPPCHLRVALPARLLDRASSLFSLPLPPQGAASEHCRPARHAPACAATAVQARACCARTRPGRSRRAP